MQDKIQAVTLSHRYARTPNTHFVRIREPCCGPPSPRGKATIFILPYDAFYNHKSFVSDSTALARDACPYRFLRTFCATVTIANSLFSAGGAPPYNNFSLTPPLPKILPQKRKLPSGSFLFTDIKFLTNLFNDEHGEPCVEETEEDSSDNI